MENGDRSYQKGATGHLVHLYIADTKRFRSVIAERCSVTVAVVSNDQLIATAKWHCVVRNTENCWC